MFIALSNMSLIVAVAVFGGVVALVWAAAEYFVSSRPRVEERLDELRDPTRRRDRDNNMMSTEAMTSLLEHAAPTLAKPLQPKNEADTNKLKSKLSHAGFRSEAAPTMFLGLKIACLCVGAFLGGGLVLLSTGFTQTGLIQLFGIAGTMFYFPDLILMLIGSKRKEQIFLGLPDALDLMVVCVEAGLGLDQAMRKVAEEMKKSHPRISEEFSICNLQLQMGRTRNEVLTDLGARSGVDDLRALASILIQADKFGSSIAQALRVQSDSMRTRRRQIAEEKAAKTAVKLIFPLVLFIFPGIFVVLVGPAAITMIREMLPAMGGN